MDQNPEYFPGYYTEGRKVDVEGMDRMLLERCAPWILATDQLTSEAALDEYVDAVISLIELDGTDPRHRYDVQEQALSTINVLVNKQGQHASLNSNQETRMFMREQYLKSLIQRLFDRQHGNAYSTPSAELVRRRNELRGSFKTILDVDPSVVLVSPNGGELPLSPHRIAHVEAHEQLKTPSHIKVECPDRHRGLALARGLSRKVKRTGWKICAGYTESGSSGTLEIYPDSMNRIQKRSRHPDDAVRTILQPVEEFLTANGCTPGTVINEDPRWITIQWQQQ